MTRPLSDSEKARYEPVKKSAGARGWLVTDQYIGGGGGADVLLALQNADVEAFRAALPLPPTVAGANTITGATTEPARLIQFIAERLVSRRDVLAAIKIPKQSEPRIRQEIAAMTECRHPNLVRLLDADEHGPAKVPAWFVMEYLPFGTIEQQRERFSGQPLTVLRSIRGVVEAVAALSQKGYFHRDIKPNNIFVGDDGRWILGDLGIVLDTDNTAHTTPGHQLFSRDWIPDWCVDFPDNYDAVAEVHTLAKTILYMVSGKRPRASQIDAIDLRQMFPDTQGIRELQDFLRAEIKPRKDETASKNAEQFLDSIDRLVDRIARPPVPSLLFNFFSAAGEPIVNVSEIRIYIPHRTNELFASFKFRADNSNGSGTFAFTLKDFPDGAAVGTSKQLVIEDPPGGGRWFNDHRMPFLIGAIDPGWYTLSFDVTHLGRIQLIGAMVYG